MTGSLASPLWDNPVMAYGFLLVAGVLATEAWRVLGVLLSNGIDEASPLLAWVKAVSTALVAGLVARIVVFPPGALADVALWLRLAAFVLGVAVFFAARRNVGFGILSGAFALMAVHALTGG